MRPGSQPQRVPKMSISVSGAGVDKVNAIYMAKDPRIIPMGFSLTCAAQKWDPESMWLQLSNQQSPWFEAENGSYMYWNKGDGKWWVDAPDGKGVYVAVAPGTTPPPVSGWQ